MENFMESEFAPIMHAYLKTPTFSTLCVLVHPHYTCVHFDFYFDLMVYNLT